MDFDNRICPICASSNKEIIKHIKMVVPEDFLLPSEYNIVSCKNCGFIFNDVPNSDVYNQYYRQYKNNTKFTIPSDINYSLNKEKREHRHFKTANFIENNAKLSRDSFILDVGCSYGATLFTLKEMGYCNLYGIDLDEESISFLRKSGINAKIGNIFSNDIKEFENKFDLIILGHILEHLHEPQNAIINISKWLKSDGKVIIECPDLYQYPKTSPFPGFFAEYEHINHFSIISLVNLMLDFNLKAYSSDTTYGLIEQFPCLYTLFERAKSKNILCRTKNDELCMRTSLVELNEQGRLVYSNIEKIQDTNIALWGAGQYLYSLLTHTPLNKCNIQYIVDKNPDKWGKCIFDIQINDPQVLMNFDGVIVICTTTCLESVVEDIKNMGISNDLMIPLEMECVY